jgi:eukaryotic-like serine/threonine-protein kinase
MKPQRTPPSSGTRVAASGLESHAGAAEPQSYLFGPFRLVPGEHVLRRGEQVLPLPPKAFETLLLLVRNPGHLLRKDDLMTALWPDSFVEEVSLASKISLVRKVLAGAGAAGTYIQTVPKQGYRFLQPVTRTWAVGQEAGISAGTEDQAPGERAIRFVALPFRLRQPDERLTYLERSLPEGISAALAGLRAMTVRPSLLAERMAEARLDSRQIAREAEVDYLLAGTILCEGDRVRVAAELVHAPTDALVGSHVCVTGRDNLIEVQDSLVRGVVALLGPRLTERERRILAHSVPASARAYEFYLRATYMERQRTFESLTVARDLYRQCLDEDPDYAPAWAHLARCYRFLEKFGVEGPEGLELARWAFHRAFALSPELPLAHHLYTPLECDGGRAQAAMVRLLGQAERHPNDPGLFVGLVQACRYCGLLNESIRAHHRARQLDSRIVTSVAFTFFFLGDYEGALEWYPPGVRVYLDVAALAAMGREAEAARLIAERHLPWEKNLELEALRLSLRGDRAGCVAIVRQALEPAAFEPEAAFLLSRQLAHEGEHAEALRTIRDLVTGGFVCSTALRNDPWLLPLAQLPDFQEVMAMSMSREAEARAAFEGAGLSFLPLG